MILENVIWKYLLEKLFIGHVNRSNDSINPLLVKLPKWNGSTKVFHKVKYLWFVVDEKRGNILNKLSEISDRIK